MAFWQMMELAPKDGTLIQGLRTAHGGYDLFRCYWKNGRWRQMEFDIEVKPDFWRHDRPEKRTQQEQPK